MSNSIEEALKKAVKQVESGTVQEGKGAEPEAAPLSARVKRLLARKTNLQRKNRRKLPKTLRWKRNHLRKDMKFANNVHT